LYEWYIEKIIIFLLAFVLIGITIYSVAFIVGVNQANKNYGQQDSVYKYSDKRTEEEIKQRKHNLNMLVNTGKCVDCDLTAKQSDEKNEDLYQAIQSSKNKGLIIDFSGANLSFARLDGIDLSGANLSKANLTATKLSKANLSNANLSETILAVTQLNDANLQGANLTEAILNRTLLERANLTNATLHKAALEYTNLREANLTKANVTGAWIINILSFEAKFVEADLRGAKILGNFAKNADFTRAQFDGWFMRSLRSFSLWLMTIWGEIKGQGYYWKLRKLERNIQ